MRPIRYCNKIICLYTLKEATAVKIENLYIHFYVDIVVFMDFPTNLISQLTDNTNRQNIGHISHIYHKGRLLSLIEVLSSMK